MVDFQQIKADVEALMGIEFFKLKDGNGQVFYMKKDKSGKSRIKKLHQKQRPTAFDSDDDCDDEGFQDQMFRDPFFDPPRRKHGAPPKKKKKVSFGHMVRKKFFSCFYHFILFYFILFYFILIYFYFYLFFVLF